MSSTDSDTCTGRLFAPNSVTTDSLHETGLILFGDYDVNLANRLFHTMEHRLAQIILYFDDVSRDVRLIDSIKSELNFLRACWGEVRLSLHVLPPASAFLQTLQDSIDRSDWSTHSQMREHASKALTTARASHGARLTDEEFPISDWWTQLPFVVTQIPDSWEGFDIADEVLYESLQQFETEEGEFEAFMDTLAASDELLRSVSNDMIGKKTYIGMLVDERAAIMKDTESNDSTSP